MKRVLIVDDDGYLAGSYQLALTNAGLEVKTIADGAGAVEAAKQFGPDLISLDLIMPIKDGLSPLQDLKNIPSLKDIPVVIVTNLDQSDTKQRARDLGAKDYLVKGDLSIDSFVAKIESHLQ